MRFDQFVRPSQLVRDVKQRHPDSVEIFERHGFRGPCDDCTIEQVCRKYGLDSLDIVGEINHVVFDRAT